MKQMFNSLTVGCSDAVFIVEVSTGLIFFANQAACKLIGYEEIELVGMHQTQLHPPEDLEYVSIKFKEFTNSDKYKETFVNVLHKSGNIIPVKITSANLFNYEGRTFIAGFFKDMTPQKNLREIAFHQAHIVRAPLANIMGIIDHIENKNIPAKDMDFFLKTIMSEAHKLDNSLRDVVNKTYFPEDKTIEKLRVKHQ